MTRRLVIVRHASAGRADPGSSDIDRALDAKGRRQLPAVAAEVASFGRLPGVVVASPARRVRQTVAGVLPAVDTETVSWSDRLYLAELETLLAEIRELPAAVTSAMLAGHNPGLHRLVIELDGSDGVPRASFPTGAVAAFDIDVAWAEVEPRSGRPVLRSRR